MTRSVEVDAKMADSDASAWLSDRAAVRWLAVLVAYAAVRAWSPRQPAILVRRNVHLDSGAPTERPRIWSALERAADGQGPAYYVIERAASGMFPNQEIALRLPSIFGFCCLRSAFFFRAARGGQRLCADLQLVLFTTVLFDFYAIEARAYSLVVACVAVALVCYQRASSWPWALPMGLCLALAESLHYYAVFALIPFGLAEAARFLRTREIRMVSGWRCCAEWCRSSFSGRCCRVSAYLGRISGRSRASLRLRRYMGRFSTPRRGGACGRGRLALGVLGAALPAGVGKTNTTARSETCSMSKCLTSIVGFAVRELRGDKIWHGGLTERYMLPAVLGVPLALGFILPRLGRRSVALLAAFVFFGVGAREAGFWLSHRGPRRTANGAPIDRALVKPLGTKTCP